MTVIIIGRKHKHATINAKGCQAALVSFDMERAGQTVNRPIRIASTDPIKLLAIDDAKNRETFGGVVIGPWTSDIIYAIWIPVKPQTTFLSSRARPLRQGLETVTSQLQNLAMLKLGDKFDTVSRQSSFVSSSRHVEYIVRRFPVLCNNIQDLKPFSCHFVLSNMVHKNNKRRPKAASMAYLVSMCMQSL